MLVRIERPIAESVWSVLSIPRTRWTAWQSERHSLYVLTPWNERSEVIVHYSEAEVLKLTEDTNDTIKNDIAFRRRKQVQPGFSERPEPE